MHCTVYQGQGAELDVRGGHEFTTLPNSKRRHVGKQVADTKLKDIENSNVLFVTISLPTIPYFVYLYLLAVWLSGNALASINVVALRQTRLVLGWVTVCGQVNNFGM